MSSFVNIGRANKEIQPLYDISYMSPTGGNVDAKILYGFDFESKNTA